MIINLEDVFLHGKAIKIEDYKINLNPNDLSESSINDDIFASNSFLFKVSASKLVSSSDVALIIATCLGAILGGNIKPLSSP